MAQDTSIEWTDKSWNFLRGCSRVSEGCRHCYAEKIAGRFSGEGQPYHGLATMNGEARWTGEIGFYERVLLEPLRWRKPCRVFVNSMSDLFHEKVKDEWLDKAFAVMALTRQNIYQALTKRADRALAYLSEPDLHVRIHEAAKAVVGYHSPQRRAINREDLPLPNVWLGVSVEDQKTADERIPLLLQTPAAVRWISAEPLLGPVELREWLEVHCLAADSFDAARADPEDWTKRLDWVVVGGESGTQARPCDITNIRLIVEACKRARVPVFVKQLGSKPFMGIKGFGPLIRDRKGGDMSEWPEDLRVREFPGEANYCGRLMWGDA